jgi:hypothetical protein
VPSTIQDQNRLPEGSGGGTLIFVPDGSPTCFRWIAKKELLSLKNTKLKSI